MGKILGILKNNKIINLIKITFISLVLLLNNIPLSSLAASNITPETGSIYYFDVESGQDGWQTDGLWHITTNRYNSPVHSFWYGNETTKTYNTGAANSGSLISPEITLQDNSQPVLDFWSWYQTEYSQDNDMKLVQISVNNGAWIDLLKITDARSTWNKESIDLSAYAGNTIRLRFLFDTVDDKLNNYEGWYVDDISLSLKESALTPTPASVSVPQPAPSQVSTGNTYYVATNGNDNWPGNETQPWRTIQHAANTVSAGDLVYVMGGTYKEKITITKSGSPGKYITFEAYPGQTAIIDGTGISLGTWGGLIYISGASYINIIGLNVLHSTFAGIMVTSNYGTPRIYPSNILIQNNYISDTTSSGIYTEDGNYITYDGNEVTHAQTLAAVHTQQNEIIDMVRTNNFEIKNNKIHDNNNFESIDVKEGSSYGSIHHNSIIPVMSAGIYIDSQGKNAQNIDVYNNRIHNGTSSQTRGIALATESGASLSNVRVYNNIVYNNAAIGIAIASYSIGPIDNVTFSSNTVYNNGLVDNWGGGIVIEYTSATNVKIVNNIAYHNQHRGDLVTDNVGNSALYTNLVGINPVFINANNQDFHLQGSSPAIDNGSSPNSTLFVPAYDFDGNSRPQGAGYDIGAYEFVSAPVSFDFSLSLNPSNGSVVQGESASTTATATLISGTSRPVSFSCSGLPEGASCSFSPPSVNPTGSSTLTILTSSTTPIGVHPITISGTDGSITRNATYSLNVIPVTPAPFNFSVSLSPSNGSVTQGDNISTITTATLISGTSQQISFSCSGLPPGALCSFDPSILYPTNSSTFTISTSPTTPLGTYPVTVSGTDGTITRDINYSLEVTAVPPVPFNFSISLSPSNGSVVQGENISTTATATLISGASQPVSFSCSGLPDGANCSFNPSALYPTNSSILIVSTSASTPAGTYSIAVNGVSGSITMTANYTLTVNTTNPSIGEAVDNTALQWTTGGNAIWFGQSSVYYYGNSAAQSGRVGDNQNTWVQTTVTGPGTLKFYWKVSSERNDYLNFYIDGSQRAKISGNTSWIQRSYTISSGTHTLKWMYTKNGANAGGSDAGWLDKVVYTPRT